MVRHSKCRLQYFRVLSGGYSLSQTFYDPFGSGCATLISGPACFLALLLLRILLHRRRGAGCTAVRLTMCDTTGAFGHFTSKSLPLHKSVVGGFCPAHFQAISQLRCALEVISSGGLHSRRRTDPSMRDLESHRPHRTAHALGLQLCACTGVIRRSSRCLLTTVR